MNCGDYLIIVHLSGHSNIKWKPLHLTVQTRKYKAWTLHCQTQQTCLHFSIQNSFFEVAHHAGYYSSNLKSYPIHFSIVWGKQTHTTDSALIIIREGLLELLSSQKEDASNRQAMSWAGNELGENSGRWGATDRLRRCREGSKQECWAGWRG